MATEPAEPPIVTPEAVQEYWNSQPHPKAPNVSVGEFPIAVRLATKTKFGGHATPEEASAFWKEFQGLGMSPGEYEELLDRVAPVSFSFHGRPPTMNELAKFREAKPSEVHDYYYNLPDKHYPHVKAGDMVKNLQAARPWAKMHLQREPTKGEAAYLHHSNHSPQDYYQTLKADLEAKGGTADHPQ